MNEGEGPSAIYIFNLGMGSVRRCLDSKGIRILFNAVYGSLSVSMI